MQSSELTNYRNYQWQLHECASFTMTIKAHASASSSTLNAQIHLCQTQFYVTEKVPWLVRFLLYLGYSLSLSLSLSHTHTRKLRCCVYKKPHIFAVGHDKLTTRPKSLVLRAASEPSIACESKGI